MERPASVTAKTIMTLVERQRFRCAISGRELTPQTASLDHIVPLARGGEHGVDNIWVVDQHINSAKGTMTLDEFVAMCRDVVRYQASTPAAAVA